MSVDDNAPDGASRRQARNRTPKHTGSAAGAEVPIATPGVKRPDPERGFRGVMSGALLLQAITVPLGLPVASAAGPLAWWEITLVLLLTAGLIALCAFVKKPWAVPAILGLQAVNIACWVVHPALGVVGVIFAVAWWTLLHFRNEYRRRLAEGSLPSQRPAG